ncbi:hypothetical protein EJ04DRAFT_576024 [Polyplosphaeria fusca]|uniref:Uncharacterized protein n=1 Tax=Polyplosphaeria fusca TaxID=682080 RepID=A0A9P4R2Z5_9PLEO|nr:hypothetical protein EJ04DRAFT_576024 [Polyplosphaeria fusca]
MHITLLPLLATLLTSALALPAAEVPNPISPKRDPGLGGLEKKQDFCPGFGNICFNDQNCKDVQCRGCIDAPEVDPNHMICY